VSLSGGCGVCGPCTSSPGVSMHSYCDLFERLAGEFDRCSVDASEIVVSSVLIERGFCSACLSFVHCSIRCEYICHVAAASRQPLRLDASPFLPLFLLTWVASRLRDHRNPTPGPLALH